MRPGQTAPECFAPGEIAFIDIVGFNEAGADCPGMQVDGAADSSGMAAASMRPGQTAPECRDSEIVKILQEAGFNEAGADCPGMPSWRMAKNAFKCRLQ